MLRLRVAHDNATQVLKHPQIFPRVLIVGSGQSRPTDHFSDTPGASFVDIVISCSAFTISTPQPPQI
jgi:hypothetical protein